MDNGQAVNGIRPEVFPPISCVSGFRSQSCDFAGSPNQICSPNSGKIPCRWATACRQWDFHKIQTGAKNMTWGICRRLWGLLAVAIVSTTLTAEESIICRHCLNSPFSADRDEPGRKYAPDRQVDVTHIKIDVTPDFEAHTVGGTTTITFKPISQPLRELHLNAKNLTIAEVRGSSDVEQFISTAEDLTVIFREDIAVGDEAWVAIDHSAQPKMGFYFRTPDMGYPESDTHVWTQGETQESRHWFPCFDYPNERSSTEVICHVPRDMTVLSNGERMSEEIDDAGLKAVRWLQKKPHVNYLICLVAGYFEKLEGQHGDTPLAFYTQPTLAKYAANSFQDTASIMAFFEKEIGIHFPWNKYYQVTIRDFTAGGMENTTLTTLTHTTIFSSETENLKSTRSLDAHEMAHQWFGDYVTCKDWSQLWLNEGFATYYSALYEGEKFGPDALLYRMYSDASNRVLPSGAKDKRPIVYKDYKNPGEQFDFRCYPKGAWVLHMLRNQLGTDLYRRCIKTYLERNALTSVVTEELSEVIEELSGKSMDRFFDQWVYHGGHPNLSVSYRWQNADGLARVTVRQTQQVDDDVLLFEIPTKIRFWMDDHDYVDYEIVINSEHHDFYVDLPAPPRVVRFDPDYSVLADVTFPKSDAMLLSQLSNESDMIGRLLAVKALSRRRTLRSVAALETTLNEDAFFGVRVAAARALRSIGTDKAFEALLQSREQSDARVRIAVVENLGKFYRPETKRALLDVVKTETNPEIAGKALVSLSMFHDPEVSESIQNALRSESFRNEIAVSGITALGRQADSSKAGELLKVLKERQSELPNFRFGLGLSTLAKLARDTDERDATYEFLDSIASQPRSPVRIFAIRALGELRDPRATAMLTAFASDETDNRLARLAKDALTALQKETPLAPREVQELRKQVEELRFSQDQLRSELEQFREVSAAKQAPTETKNAGTGGDQTDGQGDTDDAQNSNTSGSRKSDSADNPPADPPSDDMADQEKSDAAKDSAKDAADRRQDRKRPTKNRARRKRPRREREESAPKPPVRSETSFTH